MALQPFVDQNVPGPKRDYVGYGRHIRGFDGRTAPASPSTSCSTTRRGRSTPTPRATGRTTASPRFRGASIPRFATSRPSRSTSTARGQACGRVQRLVDGLGVPMTFFAAATALERNPEVAAWLRESHHEPCSHGWRWEEVWRLGRDLERQHIQWAIESFEVTVGERPLGWYCRYGPSVHTASSSSRRAASSTTPTPTTTTSPTSPRCRVSATSSSPTASPTTTRASCYPRATGRRTTSRPPSSAASTPTGRRGAERPGMMSIGLHPRLVGQATRIAGLRDFLEHALDKGEVWFATRLDIANWWLEHHEEFTP